MVEYEWDKLKEECGVFGILDHTGANVANSIYYGLCALQHRGQESAGIAVCNTGGPLGNLTCHKDMGLVNDIFTPLMGLILGGINFAGLSIKVGEATVAYGSFIQAIINFLLIAFSVFMLIKIINKIPRKKEEEKAPTTKKCPYCKSEIAIDAVKCPHCTSDIEE